MNEEDPASRQPEGYGSTDLGVGGAPEISRRVGAILDAVEREAATLREQARQEAAQYLDHARHRADSLVEERQRRIGELSDELLSKAEAVVGRLDDAAPVRQGFENLVRALGDAAERLSRETEISAPDFEPQPFHHAPPPAPGPPEYASEAPSYAPPPQPLPPAQPQPVQPPAQNYPSPPPDAPSAPPGGYPPQPHPARTPEPPGWGTTERRATPPPSPAEGTGSADWRELDEARMVAIQMAASGATRATVRKHLHQALGVAQTTGVLDEIYGINADEDARVPWTARPR